MFTIFKINGDRNIIEVWSTLNEKGINMYKRFAHFRELK